MKKWMTRITCIGLLMFVLAGCGKNTESADGMSGSCEDILQKVYDTADLDDSFRESLQYYETGELSADNCEYMLGTTDISYSDSVYSVPMMSSVPYQCVILRLSEGEDVTAAKETLSQNADPAKWICVVAESVAVENVGDVVLAVMGDTDTVDAVKNAFLALGE